MNILRQRALAACGIAGPGALVVYFVTPAFTGWPYAGASPESLTLFANAHAGLFNAGAWLQGTGTVLCVAFFVGILQLAGPLGRPASVIALISAAALLSVVLVEGALLVAAPVAAAGGDTGTVATTFALSNRAFLRTFAIAPASVTYMALGVALLRSRPLGGRLAYAAIGLGAAFELAGLAAVFTAVALAAIAALSVLQALWIVAAAIATWRFA